VKQAVMTSPGVIEYRDMPVPEMNDDQILVKIKRIGICGSDIHVNHGKHPYTTYPVVQGHEVSAQVIEAGRNVANVKPGDKVTIQPQVVCGVCYPCTHGMYNDCENLKVMGFQTTGMASEFFVTEGKKALKLPDNMSWEHGAMIEPLSVAVHALRRFGDVNNKAVLVLGGGPIGNLTAQTAKAMSASKVMISEISANRRKIARDCGIEAVNPNERDFRDTIADFFGSDGADVIFECVGVNATMEQAINNARKGSDIIVVGVFAALGAINMGFVQDHELRLIGTAMYREEDYIEAIRLAGNGKILFDPLITNHFSFDAYKEAYDYIDKEKDQAMKVMIVLDE